MTIKFYDYAPAPSPRKARMVLAEKDIPHENIQVDMMKAEQLSSEFRSINPNCTIPALVLEDGTALFDNLGIAAWAEEYKPDPSLVGQTPAEKGLVMSWVAKCDMHGGISFMEAYRNSHPKMAGRAIPGKENYEQIPELAERGFARLAVFLDDLNAHLEGRDWIALDQFSLADIWAFSILGVTPWIKAAPGEQHPNILRWQAAINERPSAKL